MKILVLNGSPTPNGNTVALVNAFKDGAESKGHEVNVVNVAHKNIKGCMACNYCKNAGNGQPQYLAVEVHRNFLSSSSMPRYEL